MWFALCVTTWLFMWLFRELNRDIERIDRNTLRLKNRLDAIEKKLEVV